MALACVLGGLGAAALPVPSPGDVTEELDRIDKDLRTEFQHLRKAAQEIDDDQAVAQMLDEYYRVILPEFLERYAEVARQHRGTEDAFQAWSRLLRQASSSSTPCAIAREALTALTTDHIASEGLDDVCATLRYGVEGLGEEPVIAALETVSARSPLRGVRARALFALGAVLGEDREDGDPRLARAREVLRRVMDEYPEEPSLDRRPCGEAARSLLFALDNLRVGRPCPDFEAVDAEGTSFKLSDYRGKVVLVDFWGFW
jgi:HEAT repeat protein